MPTFPVALSLDTTTIISLTAVVMIVVTIILIFKHRK
jgi:hypothetical protein